MWIYAWCSPVELGIFYIKKKNTTVHQQTNMFQMYTYVMKYNDLLVLIYSDFSYTVLKPGLFS